MSIRIVRNRLLGAWFVVRGPHHTPLGGPHATRADAVAWLDRARRAAFDVWTKRPLDRGNG